MSADDLQNFPSDQGFSSELDASSPYTGNRPASGARRATPGEVLSQGFQGAQNAGDFLGLDTEFTASQDPSAAYGAAGPLDLVPPPGLYDPSQGGYADVVPEPAPQPETDAVQDFAQAPSAFEFGEDLGSEDGASAFEEPAARSKAPLFAAALAMAALAAGGVFFGPSLYTRFFPGEQTVASKPTGPEATPRTREPRVATSVPDAPESVPSGSDPVVTPEPDPVESFASEPAAIRPSPGGVGEPSLPDFGEPEVALGSESGASDVGEPVAVSAPTSTDAPTSFPDFTGAEYSWTGQDPLELIWRGSEVPLEAVRAPVKTLMPRVGAVRVFTNTGDVFDGRLYAVGQNRVWIDAAPGRIGLDGDMVERIEVLPPAPAGQVATLAQGQAVGGRAVRVRVPGGLLYGSVLKSEGEDVILALSDGGRVRVRASEVEDLGSGRAVVVRR